MTQSIWYDKRVPLEIRTPIAPILEELAYVLPTWLHEIAVHFDPGCWTNGGIGLKVQHAIWS